MDFSSGCLTVLACASAGLGRRVATWSLACDLTLPHENFVLRRLVWWLRSKL